MYVLSQSVVIPVRIVYYVQLYTTIHDPNRCYYGLLQDLVHPCKVELQRVIHFIPNFITSSILTINASLIRLKVFSVNNGIPLEKANECTLINTIPCWPDDGRLTAETCSRM